MVGGHLGETRLGVGGDLPHLLYLAGGPQGQDPAPDRGDEGGVLGDDGVDEVGPAGGDVQGGHPAHGVPDDDERGGQGQGPGGRHVIGTSRARWKKPVRPNAARVAPKPRSVFIGVSVCILSLLSAATLTLMVLARNRNMMGLL